MRRLVGSNSFQNEYWESIEPKALATVIDVLPSEEDLFYYAKLIADDLMRNLDADTEIQYARYVEGTITYLCMTQSKADVDSLADYYIPFIFVMTKLYSHIQTMTFAHLFQQFVKFASKQKPPEGSDDVCTVIDIFMARLKKETGE